MGKSWPPYVNKSKIDSKECSFLHIAAFAERRSISAHNTFRKVTKMKSRQWNGLQFVFPALFCATFAHAAEHRKAGAHVHGAGVLNVVQEKAVLSVEFISPLDSIVGFEYEAKTAPDKKKMADAMNIINNPASIFVVEGGTCKFAVGKVNSTFEEEGADEREEAEAAAAAKAAKKAGKPAPKPKEHEEHASLTVSYTITCDNEAGLKSLQVKLFDSFPRLEKIDVNFVGAGSQKAGTLTKKSTTFSWK